MPRPRTPLRLSDFLPYRLSVLTNRASSRLAELYEEKFNLTIWQWRVLAVLAETPGLTATDVTARTAMDKVAVSRAVSGLMEMGLLERAASQTDGRVSLLGLTAKGKETYDGIAPLARDYEAKLLSALTKDERRQLDSLLTKLTDAVSSD